MVSLAECFLGDPYAIDPLTSESPSFLEVRQKLLLSNVDVPTQQSTVEWIGRDDPLLLGYPE